MGILQNNIGSSFGCDKYVCSECVVDEYLSQIIQENLTNRSCSYCSNTESSSMEVFLETVNFSILNYYADAQDLCVPTNNKDFEIEGEFIRDILCEFDPGWNDDLMEDAAYYLDQDKFWLPHARGNWGTMKPDQVMEYGWKQFVKTVKTKTRYFFDSEPIDEREAYHPDYLPVSYVLSELERVVTKLGLIKTINAGTDFFRVQSSNLGEIFKYIRLSVPPIEFATAGRMNPEGIPYFYVSSELETAQTEALEDIKHSHHSLHVTNKTPLMVLDLTELPEKPSIFEYDKYNDLHELYFLDKFSKEISKPILKNHNLEYVATQIVSEYFRYRFKHDGKKIDGIKFKSSKSNGSNFALFYSSHDEVKQSFKKVSIKKH